MVSFFVKATLILALATIATALMRRASAASRHLVWTCALLAVLLLPVATAVLPVLPLPLLSPSVTDTVLSEHTSLPELQTFEAVPAPAFPDPSPSARGVSRSVNTPASVPQRDVPWAALVWAVGAAAVVARFAVGVWLRTRLQWRSRASADERLLAMTTAAAESLGIRRPVTLLIAPAEMMPATWGLWRPKLLLPPSAQSWTDERLQLVLVHELAHIARLDIVSTTIARAATALIWWHPLVWLATSRAQLERERACDDTVLRAGVPASTYAEELLSIAQSLPSPFAERLALAMARPNRLGVRVSSILDGSRRRTGISRALTVGAAALLAAQWPLAAAQLVPAPRTAVVDSGAASTRNTAVALVPLSASKNAADHAAPDVIAPAPTPRQYFEPLQQMLNERPAYRPKLPDFSGHWRLDGTVSPMEYQASQSAAPFGAEFIATQDGDGLVIESVPVPVYSTHRGGGGLTQVQPVERTGTARFLFSGAASNAGVGGSISSGVAVGADGKMRTTGTRSLGSYTVRDNARWDSGVLDITTTETSQSQDYTTRIRRLSLDRDAIVIETTTWTNYQPQVVTARYVRAPLPATLTPPAQSAPQPIPYGQFGAGAYRPGNGVSNPYRKKEVKPTYTVEARQAGIEGTVELEAVVGEDGAITEVRVVRSLDSKLGLDEDAKSVVRQTPFLPCKIGDKPVACLVVFELAYKLDTPQGNAIPAGRFGAGAYRINNAPTRLRVVRPQYTPEAMRQKIEGVVALEFVVGPDGAVTDVRVTQSLDTVYGLDDQAIKALRATPFLPTMLNGVPVSVLSTMEITFTLR